MKKTQLILIAGPYRSGTNDDPGKMASNLERLERAALAVYQAGHMPLIGEWAALPLIHQAGGRDLDDPIHKAMGYPVADRMLDHCTGVLRLPGVSKGADGDVALAGILGLPVYTTIEDIPPSQECVPRPQ